MFKSSVFTSWFLLLVLSLIWGSSFILIKIGLTGFSASEVGAIRIVSASLFLLPLALPRLRKLNKRHWLLLGIVGLCGSLFPAFLFAVAETQLPSSVAGILNTLTPLFTMVIGILIFDQRTTFRTFTGLFLGFTGSVYLVLAGDSHSFAQINWYSMFVVLATIFYGINLNLIKYRITDLDARTITSISLFIAGVMATIFLFGYTDFIHHISKATYKPLAALLTLGILGTAIALILFNKLVKLTNPIFTSSVTYIIPIVAVTWGILDGEHLSIHHYIGMILVIMGVYIINRPQRSKK